MNKEDQRKAGVEIAGEMEEKVRSFTAGIQVSAPFSRYSIALEVAEFTNGYVFASGLVFHHGVIAETVVVV